MSLFESHDDTHGKRFGAKDQMMPHMHRTFQAAPRFAFFPKENQIADRGLYEKEAPAPELRPEFLPELGAELPELLAARVRAALSTASRSPGAIRIDVQDGIATLSGPVLAQDKDRVLATACRVPGIRSVVDRLEAHEPHDKMTGLSLTPYDPPNHYGRRLTWVLPLILVPIAGAAIVTALNWPRDPT